MGKAIERVRQREAAITERMADAAWRELMRRHLLPAPPTKAARPWWKFWPKED